MPFKMCDRCQETYSVTKGHVCKRKTKKFKKVHVHVRLVDREYIEKKYEQPKKLYPKCPYCGGETRLSGTRYIVSEKLWHRLFKCKDCGKSHTEGKIQPISFKEYMTKMAPQIKRLKL